MIILSLFFVKTGAKVATNKVSTKVLGLAMSQNGDYFVTVGNRHVKFWYFDTDKKGKQLNSAHPLQGRSGILGEQRNQCFQDVVCGRGTASQKTFSVTRAGHLVEFNSQRMLERLVNLKVTQATCVTATESYVICGCSNGIIRLFNPLSLQFVCVMPRPHVLGLPIPSADIAESVESPANSFPDVLSISMDETNQKMSVVYTDHSIYIWNVKDFNQITKSKSFLAHSDCIWGVETFLSTGEDSKCALPAGTFVTCSADSTLMFWNLDSAVEATNIYCKELQRVIYVDNSEETVSTDQRGQSPASDSTDGESKCGIRVVKVSPNGQFLACGDRAGNIRIYNLESMSEELKIEAHDSEILSLDFSHSVPGHYYLASSSRDRLIHVFKAHDAYELLQTIDDHSGAITAVQFTAQQNQLHLMSCGADKSVMFRTLITTLSEPKFVMSHHVSTKATLYDMQIDATGKYAAVACQDRKVRIYNINSGKLTRSYKASLSDEGTLIKIELDRSGLYAATSGSNKVLCLYDFYSGQCIASMYGHSELVTDVKFTRDITRLISVSGDRCRELA
jgi:WD40 repeat protein